MIKKIFPVFFLMFILIIFSCTGQADTVFVSVPDSNYFKFEQIIINTYNIIDTEYGNLTHLPAWMRSFISGGIEEIEKLDSFYGKYVFLALNESVNFSAQNFWVSNFSEVRDFTIMAARRIEKKMILSSTLYPDDEYGAFFEAMVKKANNTVFTGAVKEDSCWIKFISGNGIENADSDIYISFLLLTIDISLMQRIVTGMMNEIIADVSVTRTQRNNINRMRQNFFTGF